MALYLLYCNINVKVSVKWSVLLQDKKHAALSELEISRLGSLVKVLKDTSHYHSTKLADTDIAVLLRLLKSWPDAMIFPGWNARLMKIPI